MNVMFQHQVPESGGFVSMSSEDNGFTVIDTNLVAVKGDTVISITKSCNGYEGMREGWDNVGLSGGGSKHGQIELSFLCGVDHCGGIGEGDSNGVRSGTNVCDGGIYSEIVTRCAGVNDGGVTRWTSCRCL